MKRDMDLLRNMMIYFEDNLKVGNPIESTNLPFYDSTDDDSYRNLSDHITMLIESGLIDAKPLHMHGYTIYAIMRITSAGHDFLDVLRAETVWSAVKEKTKLVGGVTIDLMVDMAKDYIKKMVLGLV